MPGQIILQERGEPQGIYIGPEACDFFLPDAINLFYFFQITSMKCVHIGSFFYFEMLQESFR